MQPLTEPQLKAGQTFGGASWLRRGTPRPATAGVVAEHGGQSSLTPPSPPARSVDETPVSLTRAATAALIGVAAGHVLATLQLLRKIRKKQQGLKYVLFLAPLPQLYVLWQLLARYKCKGVAKTGSAGFFIFAVTGLNAYSVLSSFRHYPSQVSRYFRQIFKLVAVILPAWRSVSIWKALELKSGPLFPELTAYNPLAGLGGEGSHGNQMYKIWLGER